MTAIATRAFDYLRDIPYRKWVPLILAVFSHLLVFIALLSVLAITYALFWLKFDLTRSGLGEIVPFKLAYLMWFYSAPKNPSYTVMVFVPLLAIATWLLGTRVNQFSRTMPRRTLSFLLCSVTVLLTVCYYSALYIFPIGYEPLIGIHDNFDSPHKSKLHRESVELIATLVLLMPYLVAVTVASRMFALYRDDDVVQQWFKEYKFEHRWLGRFGDEKAGTLPDITLATRVDTGVPAVLTGDSRQLGVTLLGPPGSGKTSMKIIKAFRQDMGHLQRMINEFPMLERKYGVNSTKFKRAMAKHIIGSIIIEPAKDLCDSAYEVSRKHGLPDELIVYLDPSNEDTPGINCMIGPLSQVAETITAVLDGMSEVSNEFFRQACRTVLKMYIYLIKIYRVNDCDLFDLDRMYQDPRHTMDMVEVVEKTIPNDTDIEAMKKDTRIYWLLVKRVIRWFKNDGLAYQVDREGFEVKYQKGHEHAGRQVVIDKQTEFTRQTRNLLSDLLVNPFLARIFLNERSVDIDRIMSRGGILLCNTDNGLLGDVSDAFGKLVLMSVQNAVFRRKGDENTRALISLYVDEAYDYMNRPFLKLAGQGRKYKIAPFVAYQTLAQFAYKFDEKFVDATLGTTRNLIVYGGVTDYDAEKLSKYFGKQTIDKMTVRESYTPDRMDNPNYSFSETVTREEVAVATEDDIMFNPFKFSYCRLVYEGSTKKAFLAEGDFVDKGEADEWEKALDLEALKKYMAYWRMELDNLVEVEEVETVVAAEDGVEEVAKISEAIDDEAKELQKLAPRFVGFLDKEKKRDETKVLQGSEDVEAGEEISTDDELPGGNVESRNESSKRNRSGGEDLASQQKQSENVQAVVESFSDDEPLSFSRNMQGLLQNGIPKPEPAFEKVELEHGPQNKMNNLKDVTVDGDASAKAFVNAVKKKTAADKSRR